MNSIEDIESADFVDYLVSTLTPRHRQMIHAKIIGYTDKEIAESKIGRSESVRDVRRARRIQKDRIELQRLAHERIYGVC